jgi:SAM-dependent methyltransferase
MMELRRTFDTAAELYDRARPGYPAALFDDLSTLAGVGRGCRVLEIAPGTGQATEPLAERGCAIVAVELGAEMAAVARRRLARFPNVDIVVAPFEQFPLPAEPFDLVLCATAFHWLDPAVRIVKPARALRPGGALAVIDTHHVAGGTERFFADAQACYERWDPSTPPGLRLEPSDTIPCDAAEIDRSGLFEPVTFRRYETDIDYTTREYLDVLLTYSGHIALPDEGRQRLLDCIANLIDRDHGGRIVKRYMTELRVARCLDGRPAGGAPDGRERRARRRGGSARTAGS